MRMNVLSSICINIVFTLSSAFCSDIYITPQGTVVHDSTVWFCMDRNIGEFWNIALDWTTFKIPSKYDVKPVFRKYIETTNLNAISKKLPVWFSIIGNCRHFIIIHKDYRAILDCISYDDLQDNCKKLLKENIKELKSKCDIKVAQKLSVLTAINTSWEDALSAMKEIVKGSAFTHDFSLTEALFILHLKPLQECTNNSVLNNLKKLFPKNNEYEDKNVLFYAKCLTGAIACVLKHDKKIPADFRFDIVIGDDTKACFIRNVKKLTQAYKDYFINEKNKINNNKNKIETNKKEVNNSSQEEEKCKLKQD